MKFNTKYDRKAKEPEINSGEVLVERRGYLTIEQQVNNLLLAGERLQAARLEQYDYSEEYKDGEDFAVPNNRVNNYDLADASADYEDIMRRFKIVEEEKRQAEKNQQELELKNKMKEEIAKQAAKPEEEKPKEE